jgi:hypothetical protein
MDAPGKTENDKSEPRDAPGVGEECMIVLSNAAKRPQGFVGAPGWCSCLVTLAFRIATLQCHVALDRMRQLDKTNLCTEWPSTRNEHEHDWLLTKNQRQYYSWPIPV